MGDYKKYDLMDLTVAIGGVIVTGWADGDFISIKQNKESNNLTVGADGEGARSILYDKSAQITLTLMQTSSMNDTLSAIAIANSEFIFSCTDANGTTVVAAAHCWIREPAEVTYGSEVKERVWILETDSSKSFIGGS